MPFSDQQENIKAEWRILYHLDSKKRVIAVIHEISSLSTVNPHYTQEQLSAKS